MKALSFGLLLLPARRDQCSGDQVPKRTQLTKYFLCIMPLGIEGQTIDGRGLLNQQVQGL